MLFFVTNEILCFLLSCCSRTLSSTLHPALALEYPFFFSTGGSFRLWSHT